MAYEGCPMVWGGYGPGAMYLNWIFVAIIFSLIFWGVYYFLTKSLESKGRKKR